MKFSFSRLLILFVAATLLIPHASAQVVEIPDPNLRQAIRERLELPDEISLTQIEMLRLTKLNAKEAQIENITGLEYAINLESLVLGINNIQNITPLAGLINLDSLTLQNTPITDLAPLSNLTQLTYLNLTGAPIKDLTPLANLAQLKELHLGHCQIRDLTPLSNLTQLMVLNLSKNQIVDVSPLANLTALKKLHIDRNQVVDVSPLTNLTQLTNLTIANNPITDFRPLFGLNLQSVDVDIHKLQELTSIAVEIPDLNLKQAIKAALGLPDEVALTQAEMLRLVRLKPKEAEIGDLTGLEHAKNLKTLDLAVNNISDIAPLSTLTKLNLLILRNNPIADLSPLANLTNLTYLNLSEGVIKDLTPLSNLTELRELYLTDCQITDITPLANLTQLVRLNLKANQIVDVTPLTNLTQLEQLWISENRIVDFSPLQGLSLPDFRYDEECLLPDLPIQDRIQNRSLPSTVRTWGLETVNQLHLSRLDRISYHDIYWDRRPSALSFESTPQGYQLKGDIATAIGRREKLLSRNPNMLFLRTIRQRDAEINHHYPEDWPYWLRDEEGNLIQGSVREPDGSVRKPDVYLIDMTHPGLQDIIVQQAIAVSKCGFYDGIFFDWWIEGAVLAGFRTDEEEREARISILKRIRANVPDDFLIVCNLGHQRPLAAPYINGGFLENVADDLENGYTRAEIIEIETHLIWREENLREPQINCLQGTGIPTEPYESPTNKRWMRLFTTMSLTLTDGYVHFLIGIPGQHVHFRYPFLDVDLGQPVSPTAQRYQEVEGLYIREFTNGWAAYNRTGEIQTISLPASATPVSDRIDSGPSTTHQLPNLDGEIYLKAKNPADVNGDGRINILDLVHVANNFGKADPDFNGDGVVNILDLILVAKHLSQNAAAPSQLALIESIPSTAKEVSAVQHALAELEAIPNKSHGVQTAIELLRHYLSIADPNVQETKLLSNYPNPFNPDTWIPYQLSEGATVTLKIYDVTGSLVRTIQVGHKPAGYYHTRERAIYWDGRNQNREPVSSGVYFYTLNTDTYTQTRRMVILK